MKDVPKNQRTPLETVVPLKAPYVIYLDSSGACNFKCKFCPCNIDNYLSVQRRQIMKFDLFEKIVQDLLEFAVQIPVIYLSGFGEPFLNKRLFDMARLLKEKAICREIRVITNGSFLSPEINKEIVSCGIDSVRVSVEGLTHEDYYNISDVSVDFDELVRNIQDLFEKSRGKVKVISKIVNSCLKTEMDKEKFIKIFSPISDYYFIENVQNFWPEFDDIWLPEGGIEGNCLFQENSKDIGICTKPLTEMTIHASGDVTVCCSDWKSRLGKYNVRDVSLKEIWNSQWLKDLRLLHLTKKRNEIDFCCKCNYIPVDDINESAGLIAKRI